MSPLTGSPVASEAPELSDQLLRTVMGRTPHGIDLEALAAPLSGRRVLVTGGEGSLGRVLAQTLEAAGARSHRQYDIRGESAPNLEDVASGLDGVVKTSDAASSIEDEALCEELGRPVAGFGLD